MLLKKSPCVKDKIIENIHAECRDFRGGEGQMLHHRERGYEALFIPCNSYVSYVYLTGPYDSSYKYYPEKYSEAYWVTAHVAFAVGVPLLVNTLGTAFSYNILFALIPQAHTTDKTKGSSKHIPLPRQPICIFCMRSCSKISKFKSAIFF